MLSGQMPEPQSFPGYDFKLFDDFSAMQTELLRKEKEHGLARLLAGGLPPVLPAVRPFVLGGRRRRGGRNRMVKPKSFAGILSFGRRRSGGRRRVGRHCGG